MANNRRAGIIQFNAGSTRYDAKGAFTYNLGLPKRESIIGSDGVHGYKETPQVAFIEGEITDSGGLSLAELATLDNVTVTLQLAVGPNGPAKVILLKEGYYAGEGTGNTEEGAIGVRFESRLQGEEVQP